MRAPFAASSVGVSPSECALLEAAQERSRTDVLEHCGVIIPAQDWARFERWVNAPAKVIPALRTLAATRPAWQD